MQKYAEAAATKQMSQVQKTFNSHWGSTNPWQDERHVEIAHFIEDIAKRQPVYKYLSKKYDGNEDSISHYLNLPHPVKVFDYEKGLVEKQLSTMDSIRYMVRFMHCGFVAMEPETGHVKAWVGDIDFNSWKYDKVTAMRQPGSTFKLFVYAEAMNQGLTPCDTRKDEYFSMKVMDHGQEVTWAPTNADGRFSGADITLKQAFAMSINSVAVRLGQECGIERIVKTAHDMGIKSELNATPSLALGSSDVNLLELVNAYCTPMNDGKAHDPVLVIRILDRDGKEIYTAPTEQKQAIPYRSAYLVQQLLAGGMSGTSSRLMGFVGRHASDTDFGGKTGTSNNHSDAWFVGVSPFRTGQLGQGNRTALPICGYFLQSVLDDPAFKRYHGKFAAPKDASLTPDMYSCGGYFQAPADSDSIATDSIALDIKDVENILLDDFGNPLQRPDKTPEPDELKNVPAPQQNEEATEDKKHI